MSEDRTMSTAEPEGAGETSVAVPAGDPPLPASGEEQRPGAEQPSPPPVPPTWAIAHAKDEVIAHMKDWFRREIDLIARGFDPQERQRENP